MIIQKEYDNYLIIILVPYVLKKRLLIYLQLYLASQ